ncbi:MAG TPA: nicotinate-nicotinamide nucleotide adenylyltransferase, partial [Clostridia bacterium]|nr:nicotinate-nicotinamide nucleotide adenylyltransferase [Clostridia bacterium]
SLYYIIGGDTLLELRTWYHPERLGLYADFIFIPRKDADNSRCRIEISLLKKEYDLNIIESKLIVPDISSSIIREKIKKGESVVGLAPNDVIDYVYKHGLYK